MAYQNHVSCGRLAELPLRQLASQELSEKKKGYKLFSSCFSAKYSPSSASLAQPNERAFSAYCCEQYISNISLKGFFTDGSGDL